MWSQDGAYLPPGVRSLLEGCCCFLPSSGSIFQKYNFPTAATVYCFQVLLLFVGGLADHSLFDNRRCHLPYCLVFHYVRANECWDRLRGHIRWARREHLGCSVHCRPGTRPPIFTSYHTSSHLGVSLPPDNTVFPMWTTRGVRGRNAEARSTAIPTFPTIPTCMLLFFTSSQKFKFCFYYSQSSFISDSKCISVVCICISCNNIICRTAQRRHISCRWGILAHKEDGFHSRSAELGSTASSTHHFSIQCAPKPKPILKCTEGCTVKGFIHNQMMKRLTVTCTPTRYSSPSKIPP